ncbi:hypothetical protein K438DRAFT_577342 [Mycena galopus ATCC 62051]|nr:hypothetical protein K438DRAFT_577342 [Mycena galopus ATCC 62051]
MNPDYIFRWPPLLVNSLLPWLEVSFGTLPGIPLTHIQVIPSVPPEFINLWEDYAYIQEVVEAAREGWEEPDMTLFSGQHIVSKVPELLPTLVAIFMVHVVNEPLRHLREVLGITWQKLREIICSFRSNVAGDEAISRACVVDVSFPETRPWSTVAWDLARRHIQLIKSKEAGILPEEIGIYSLGWDLSFLVRASPPCPELYRDLWSIGAILPRPGIIKQPIIYHVSKWVEVRNTMIPTSYLLLMPSLPSLSLTRLWS